MSWEMVIWNHPSMRGSKYREFKIRSKADCDRMVKESLVAGCTYHFPAPMCDVEYDYEITKFKDGNAVLFERHRDFRNDVFMPFHQCLEYHGKADDEVDMVVEFVWENRKFINKHFYA